MNYAFAGGVTVGVTQNTESLLDRICRNAKNAAKRLIEILNQPGIPNESF